ncbi:MAG: hypothetical protein ACK5MT_00025, partial [Actinomycetales bacterium]
SPSWQVDTATGKVTYTVVGTGAGLAKSEGICESSWCTISVQAGRESTTGTTVVASLTCTTPGRINSPWTMTATCKATDEDRPEITHIRTLITNTSNNTTLASDWTNVADPYPNPQASVTAISWSSNLSAGEHTYEVDATAVGLAKSGGVCESAWCKVAVQTGRAETGGDLVPVDTLTCDSPGQVYGAWKLTAHCAATNQVHPEITHIRTLVTNTDRGETLASEWTEVAGPYPTPEVHLDNPVVDVDTATGQVTYTTTVTATGLASATGLCAQTHCRLTLEAGRPGPDGLLTRTENLTCTTRYAYNAWTLTTICQGTDETHREITAIRGVVTNSAGTTLTSPWTTVSDPYPQPSANLTVDTWEADTATGAITYTVAATAQSLGKAGGLCDYQHCQMRIEAARQVKSADPVVVATLPCPNQYSYAPWTLSTTCTATNQVYGEINMIRPVITNQLGERLEGKWRVVELNYPLPTVSMNIDRWDYTGDDSTNGSYYAVTLHATATGLGQAGTCAATYCKLVIEGGLPDEDNTIRRISQIATDRNALGYPGTWTITADIAENADHTLVPAQTHLRATVYANGTAITTTGWQARPGIVGLPYAEALALAAMSPSIIAASNTHGGDPCVELLPGGTHTAESSLSDQQIACKKLLQSGKTLPQTIAHLIESFGPGVLAMVAASLAIPLPNALPATDSSDDPAQLARITTFLDQRVRNITGEYDRALDDRQAARLYLQQCQDLAAKITGLYQRPGQCDDQPVFAPGIDVWEAAVHDQEAILAGWPIELHYGPSKGQWYTQVAFRDDPSNQCYKGGDKQFGLLLGKDCDEYPFNSTEQGGPAES